MSKKELNNSIKSELNYHMACCNTTIFFNAGRVGRGLHIDSYVIKRKQRMFTDLAQALYKF